MSRRAGGRTRAARESGRSPQPAADGARLGRAQVRRLLAGIPARDGRTLGLERLLADAAAPDREPDRSGRGLATVLTAFADAAPGPTANPPSPATANDRPGRAGRAGHRQLPLRSTSWSRALTVRCAAVLALVFGAGMAAEADALPAPVQSLAYDVFGDLGVPPPGPTAPGPAPKTGPSPGSLTGSGPDRSTNPNARTSPAAGTQPTDGPSQTPTALSPTTLCQLAVQSLATPGTLTPPDLAQLTADAGGARNIPVYCAELLKSTGPGGYWPPGHATWPAEPGPGATGFPWRTPKQTAPPHTSAPKSDPKSTAKSDDSQHSDN